MNRKRVVIGAALALAAVSALAADTLRLNARTAVEMALRNHHAIRRAQAGLEEASSGRAATFGALLPQVSASASYFRLAKTNEFTMSSPKYAMIPLPVIDPNTGDTIGFTIPIPMAVGETTYTMPLGSANNYTLRGTASQTLFTWGKLVNAYRIAGLNEEMQREALRHARNQARVDATAGFYRALLAGRMAGVMEESRAQLERHVAQVRTLYDNGLAGRLDVMRSSVGLTNLESQVAQMESNRELAFAALRMTIGASADTPLLLEDNLGADAPAPETQPDDLEAAVASALARRPELVQLRHAAQIADLGARIARTANLPSLFAQFNYDYKRPVGFRDAWGSDWNATVGLSMPIFTGGANRHKLGQAQARHRQAKYALAQVEDAVRLEVQAGISALNQEARNIAHQSRNVMLAEEALALAEARYRNGLLTNLEYLDIQLALTQSRVSYLNSLANYRIARAELDRAMGRSEEE